MISSPGAAVRRRAIGRDIIMKTRYTVALSMIAGAALGATAIQSLHAQAKKVYLLTQSEILDRAALESYNTTVREAISKAGGTTISSDRVIAVIGTAPQRVGVTEFPSVEKVQAWLNSDDRKALAQQRDKAIKFSQQLIVEGH
jgi:uncharacterized protein (DUF1330 family)